jgi:hypothetical protein
MKKLLIIMYDYLPWPSPNTNCMNTFIKNLKEEYEIHVLASRPYLNGSEEEEFDGVQVYRTDDWYMLLRDIRLEFSRIQAPKVIRLMIILFLKIIMKVSSLFRWPDFSFGWQKGLVTKKAEELYLAHHYHVIMSVSHPFMAQLAALELKKKFINAYSWIVFEFDPFAYEGNKANQTNIPYCNDKRKKLAVEREVFQYADVIALTTELYREYTSNSLKEYSEKMVEVGIPLLTDLSLGCSKDSVHDSLERNKNTLELVFAGSMYEHIRNPRYMLELFDRGSTDNMRLHILGAGCSEIVNEYKARLKDRLVLHGQTDRATAVKAVCEADILINIGNTVLNQVPSKVFEYIGSGRPIVNVYSVDKDTSNYYLNKYDLFLGIKEEWHRIDKNAELFRNFCCENGGKRLNFNEVCRNLREYTPEAAEERFKELLK